MSDDIVIRAERLGKQYIIGHQAQRERYTALRDVIARNARGLIRSARDIASGRPIVAGDTREAFWALKEVDFEIRRGDVVGIIGSNGAGKSTLLKILSRITDPSVGRVTIRGRVASLLEVGTGFHPELTGRENIFLNGAILGMSREEIKRKFDEIVEFAEVAKFLDTPVKRYSSGMYVRLAFAVAAHLEPEILIVDEVLAVGDAGFQNKCLGKIGQAASDGRTVIIVSHNMQSIIRLCTRSLLLVNGTIMADGLPKNVVQAYLDVGGGVAGDRFECRDEKNGEQKQFNFLSASLMNVHGEQKSHFGNGEKIGIALEYKVTAQLEGLRVGIVLSTSDGVDVFEVYESDNHKAEQHKGNSQYVATCYIPGHFLAPGRYHISINCGIPGRMNLFFKDAALAFTIVDDGSVGLAARVKRRGCMLPRLAWEKTKKSSIEGHGDAK